LLFCAFILKKAQMNSLRLDVKCATENYIITTT
jgi:hypothetical protein